MSDREAVAWQVGVWDRMSKVYLREIETRFDPVVSATVRRAQLSAGDSVLDLGAGSGAVSVAAARLVGDDGSVTAVDISPEMVAVARARFAELSLANTRSLEGRGEDIPAEDGTFDVVISSLCLMFALDRAAAAREIARVLKPGGRFVASVWAGPDECDIVRFQSIAGSFGGAPPVAGVGPGSLADTAPFVASLAEVGISATVESETLGFGFPDFTSAWDVLAGVTAAQLPSEDQARAKAAVLAEMYPDGDGPRRFTNTTRFFIGERT